MSEVLLEVKNLAKFFDATQVLKDINLTVNKGDVPFFYFYLLVKF